MHSIANAEFTLPKNGTDMATSDTAVVTIAASADEFWMLDAIHVSGNKAVAQADALLFVLVGGVAKWSVQVANAAAPSGGFSLEYLFPEGMLVGAKNESMQVACDPDTAGVVRLNVQYR